MAPAVQSAGPRPGRQARPEGPGRRGRAALRASDHRVFRRQQRHPHRATPLVLGRRRPPVRREGQPRGCAARRRNPAPEIHGVDLDGRPMKLSDFRGKVVVLSVDRDGRTGLPRWRIPAVWPQRHRSPGRPRHAGRSPGRDRHRDDQEKERPAHPVLVNSTMEVPDPVMVWGWSADPDRHGVPGWYVIDLRGVIHIRSRLPDMSKVVATLLKEQEGQPEQPHK